GRPQHPPLRQHHRRHHPPPLGRVRAPRTPEARRPRPDGGLRRRHELGRDPAPRVMGLAAATAASAFGALFLLERARPLRRCVEPGLARVARNLALGGVAAAVAQVLQWLLLRPFVAWAEAHGVGLVPWLGLPRPAAVATGVVLLDYTLWHWHRWNHRSTALWRFHLVHHVDRDLDASTGLRFHVVELALSVAYRALQVAAIGAGAAALDLWSGLLIVSILFHHSNLRLPLGLERLLVRVVVTPRMHGI